MYEHTNEKYCHNEKIDREIYKLQNRQHLYIAYEDKFSVILHLNSSRIVVL